MSTGPLKVVGMRRVGKAAGRERVRRVPTIQREGVRFKKRWARRQERLCPPYGLDQPQFQTGPIGVRVQQGPKLPPL
jgi:hypothetical protein